MRKRNNFKSLIISTVFLLALTQIASADLMKISYGHVYFGLTISFNHLALKSRNIEYWFKTLAEHSPYASDIIEYNSFENIFALDKESLIKESLILSPYDLIETTDSETYVFDKSFYEMTLYKPITDIGSYSFRRTVYDLSNMIAKKSILRKPDL